VSRPPGGARHPSEAMIPAGRRRLRRLVWPASHPRGTVLLIHGFAEHAGRYGEVAQALNQLDLDVFAVELPGHGKSEGRRGDIASFEEFLLALDGLLASLPPESRERPLVIVAHSLGGLIVLRWLETRGLRPECLVLSAPWLGTSPLLSPLTRLLKWLMGWVAPGVPVRRPIQAAGLTRDPEMQARRVADPLIVNRISARLVGEVESVQPLALASGPPVPTLVISPGADPVTDQSVVLEWCARFPESVEIIEVPDARHEPFNDLGRAETIEGMCRWIDGHVP
jgi:lysophospholipase